MPHPGRGRGWPPGLFLAAYLGYAVTWASGLPRPVSLLFVVPMVAAVIWTLRRQDEVMRELSARAYEVGFWAAFVLLYLSAVVPQSIAAVAGLLWTVPLVAWLVSHVWLRWRWL